MSLHPNSLNALRRLTKAVMQNSSVPTYSGALVVRKPFILTDSEAELYMETLRLLENDEATEHLTRLEIDRELTNLVDDLTVQSRLKANKRNKKMDDFAARVAPPFKQYEVAIILEGILFDSETLRIGAVSFRTFTQDIAVEWGIHNVRGMGRQELDKLLNKPVAIALVKAGSAKRAWERAKQVVDRSLDYLRAYTSSYKQAWIYDEQLLQRRGSTIAVRQISPKIGLRRAGFDRPFGPTLLRFEGNLTKSTQGTVTELGTLHNATMPSKFQNALLRSLEWIGTSITREKYDHKIVDLCTALESILTTQDDPRKGEAIVFRFLLLAVALEAGVPDPGKIYRMYELRSQVVHGSALDICSESDYVMLRPLAMDTFLNIVKLDNINGPFKSPHELITYLESPGKIERVIAFLGKWNSKEVQRIVEYADHRFKNCTSRD